MDDETQEMFFNKFQHDINCLSDSNRAIRKSGLDKLSKELFNTKHKEYIEQLLSQNLMNPLIKCLEDQIEKHRETTINLFEKLIKEISIDKVLISILITFIIGRMDKTPFPETSEELRIKLIKLMGLILEKYKEEYKSHLPDLSKMISILLKDPCPEVKIKLSEFISKIAIEYKNEIGVHSKGIIISLCLNLKHQHNKIRKITESSLIDILLCDNAGNFLNECIPYLKVLSNDKNADVRKQFYNSICKLLENLNIVYLRKNEPDLVLLLLNGLSDDKEDIRNITKNLIEDAGNNRRKLAFEIDEDLSKVLE